VKVSQELRKILGPWERGLSRNAHNIDIKAEIEDQIGYYIEI
jgi:hypothetical protein